MGSQSYSFEDLQLQKIGFMQKEKKIYLIGIGIFFGLVMITPLTTSTMIFFVLAFICGYKWQLIGQDIKTLHDSMNKEQTVVIDV